MTLRKLDTVSSMFVASNFQLGGFFLSFFESVSVAIEGMVEGYENVLVRHQSMAVSVVFCERWKRENGNRSIFS